MRGLILKLTNVKINIKIVKLVNYQYFLEFQNFFIYLFVLAILSMTTSSISELITRLIP